MHRKAGETPEQAAGAIVSTPCTCQQVDVSTISHKPATLSIRGRADGDCPLHGDLAQIRAFGHIDVGDRLRVNSFGIWSITRYDDMANINTMYAVERDRKPLPTTRPARSCAPTATTGAPPTAPVASTPT